MVKKGKSKKKSKKEKSGNAEIWTEEEYDEYMRGLYGMSFIAGYTSYGVPYGTFLHEVDENGELLITLGSYYDDDDDSPYDHEESLYDDSPYEESHDDNHDHNPFDEYDDIPF